MPLKEKIAQPAPKIALAHKTQAAKVACVTVACAFQVSSSVKAQSSLYVRQIARVGHSKRLAPQGATATRPKDNVSPLVVTATVTLRAMKIARPVQKTVSAQPTSSAMDSNVSTHVAMGSVTQAKIAPPVHKIVPVLEVHNVKMGLVVPARQEPSSVMVTRSRLAKQTAQGGNPNNARADAKTNNVVHAQKAKDDVLATQYKNVPVKNGNKSTSAVHLRSARAENVNSLFGNSPCSSWLIKKNLQPSPPKKTTTPKLKHVSICRIQRKQAPTSFGTTAPRHTKHNEQQGPVD